MIRSMTGFGEATEQVDGVHYAVEVRSLNNRYFKALIRMPEEIAALEAELESALRRRLARGSITLTVKVRTADATAAQSINEPALMRYLDHLERIHEQVRHQQHPVHIDLTALLAMPGVLQPEDTGQLVDRTRPVAMRLLEQACDRLLTMRETEGAAIAEDLRHHKQLIDERLGIIRDRAPTVIEEYHQRLRDRIDELMARAQLKADERDLVREVALYAERSDISEELSRLSGHLDQVEQILVADGADASGRTLDFLAQELLREANTIASKSNDTTISRAIVEVKGAIDRIKEQVQNVE